jgi:hypothetical protein
MSIDQPASISWADGDGANGEGGQRTRQPGPEEVVGRTPDEHLVAPGVGDRGEQHRCVDVAVVVGGEDHRPVISIRQRVEAIETRHPRPRQGGHQSPAHGLDQCGPR